MLWCVVWSPDCLSYCYHVRTKCVMAVVVNTSLLTTFLCDPCDSGSMMGQQGRGSKWEVYLCSAGGKAQHHGWSTVAVVNGVAVCCLTVAGYSVHLGSEGGS
jgi:hypothetical protein